MEDGLRGRREATPLVLKLGLALALSLAGYFASHLRFRPRLPPPPSKETGSGRRGQPAAAAVDGGSGLKEELHILAREEALAKIIDGASTKNIFGEEEGFHLTELNKVVQDEFEADSEMAPLSPVSEELENNEREAIEEEIAYLRDLVKSLEERERNLEMEMLEYYGLKEQAASLRELESRVKINATEAKLLSMKIESLQAENQRLQGQAADYRRLKEELELEREKVKVFHRKMKSDGEQAEEMIGTLCQRIAELQERERMDGEEVEKKLMRLKELEEEAIDLRMVNSRLAQENSELEKQMESVKIASSSKSVHKGKEVESLEETRRLREENEKLKQDIEQLQTDRCADVEELVYLRWVNACLRYELRNYQPSPGKTVARDLSRCLSPKSEDKAKQLILEYAHLDVDEKNMSLLDFDSENCSSSHSSNEETSDASFDISTSTKNSKSSKSKFISKLKKLVLGKGSHRSKISSEDRTLISCGNSERRASVSTRSFEDIVGKRNSCDSVSSCTSVEYVMNNYLPGMEFHANEQWQNKGSQSQSFSRSSLDIQKLGMLDQVEVKRGKVERSKSDIGASPGHKRTISVGACLSVSSLDNSLVHEGNVPEKAKLRKFAEVLNISHGSLKLKRRSQSFHSN